MTDTLKSMVWSPYFRSSLLLGTLTWADLNLTLTGPIAALLHIHVSCCQSHAVRITSPGFVFTPLNGKLHPLMCVTILDNLILVISRILEAPKQYVSATLGSFPRE